MGDTLEHEAINEAMAIIDETLGKLAQREIMSSNEVSDLLLDVAADGQRFLLNARVDKSGSAPLTVVVNWTAEVKR